MAEEDAPGGGDAASTPPVSFPSEDFECKICYNLFDLELYVPKRLSCSHTFCLRCLEALHLQEGKGWRLGCPVCRHRTPVPEYRVSNLPDNADLTASLPLKTHEPPNTDVHVTAPDVNAVSPRDTDDSSSCHTCKQVAFVSGCACAIVSFLCMVVLLFLGLILVHNFNSTTSPAGPACLLVASVLALFSLILTWLVCMLRYRPETEAGNISSITSNVT